MREFCGRRSGSGPETANGRGREKIRPTGFVSPGSVCMDIKEWRVLIPYRHCQSSVDFLQTKDGKGGGQVGTMLLVD